MVHVPEVPMQPAEKRRRLTKDIKKPCPVPEAGQKAALELLQNGRMFRYNFAKAEESPVSQCELALAQYTGHKYCVALNSCGSAIFLMLKVTGVKHGSKVISNAFTFGAVPSAIEHAGGVAVYVESTDGYTMDVEDLRRKLAAHPDCKHVLVSHMRGKVADMDAIAAACKEHEAVLVEDCAHSLGVYWRGVHTGHAGVCCAISSQSYKMINSGEGGFFLSNNDDYAARAAVYAGAYEGMLKKHLAAPPSEAFAQLPKQLPNYSLRMSALQAAIILPQISTLGERIPVYNKRYEKLKASLELRIGKYITISPCLDGVEPVHDSLQFNLDESISEEKVQRFLKECEEHGVAVELFGNRNNGRNFVNWGFAPATEPLPKTAAMLKRACDVRLPLQWTEQDIEVMGDIICEGLHAALEDQVPPPS